MTEQITWYDYCAADSERKCSGSYDSLKICGDKNGEFICTRYLDHLGSHIACDRYPSEENSRNWFSVEHNRLRWE